MVFCSKSSIWRKNLKELLIPQALLVRGINALSRDFEWLSP